jgi:ribosomal protein L21
MKKLTPPVTTSMGLTKWKIRHAKKGLSGSSERPKAMHYFGETEVEVERQPTVSLDTTHSRGLELPATVTEVLVVEVEKEPSSAGLPVVTAITTDVRVKKKKKNNKIDTDFEDYKNKKKLPPRRI